MRKFIYKTIIILFALAIFFEFTIGKRLEPIMNNLNLIEDKQERKNLSNKIRKEMKKGLEKENILNKEDRILIRKFIDKLKLELNSVENYLQIKTSPVFSFSEKGKIL